MADGIGNSSTFIIAIDGSNASGKGTIAKMISEHYNFEHLDTGLLYRAIGYRLVRDGKDIRNLDHILLAASKPIELSELENERLREEEMGNVASTIGVHKELREILDVYQHNFPQGKAGVIIDGRDIGTAVFPNANVKLFITASAEERAKRRFKELQSKGVNVIYSDILAEVKERELRDSTRSVNPCICADDAYLVDTSSLTPAQVMEKVVKYINNKLTNIN